MRYRVTNGEEIAFSSEKAKERFQNKVLNSTLQIFISLNQIERPVSERAVYTASS